MPQPQPLDRGAIKGLRQHLPRDAGLQDEEDRKLVAHGYAPLPDFDDPRFVASEVRSFRVKEGFPRLIRSQLPVGITKVAYDIRLETIAAFACDGGAVFGES